MDQPASDVNPDDLARFVIPEWPLAENVPGLQERLSYYFPGQVWSYVFATHSRTKPSIAVEAHLHEQAWDGLGPPPLEMPHSVDGNVKIDCGVKVRF
jgi:hypothetical protein